MSTPTPRLFACSYSATKPTKDRQILLKQGMCFLPAGSEDEARNLGEAKAKTAFAAADGYADHFAVAMEVPATGLALA